jgi:lysine 2,3-aminomutase
LPYRINEGFLKLLKKYHQWGKREICIMTHYSHPSELTPDSLTAVKKIKRLGINIYNQQVFTYYNSRRFETCYLRRALKVSGIDPYYAFNKGKGRNVGFQGSHRKNRAGAS